ncbi:MurR/RpiR family transcriptional regulator [Siminovitchia sp. 179-K 8D1 HS]|uniref:MurR/RpiR family transcriptional regulator n=1 Tax=Siminovitchia sp. 179-K 8D1 HS TaxID=3142385 RepID=UPI0039A2ECC0
MNKLRTRIRQQYKGLTKGQQRIAKYLMDHIEEVAFHTAKELGELTGTSETTVIRLSYTLGFTGYSELQKLIQDHILLKQQSDALARYRDSASMLSDRKSWIQDTIKEDMDFIQKTMHAIDEQLLEHIVEKILDTENIFIAGARSSFAPASWLHFCLNIVKGNTHLYRGNMDDAIYYISQLTDKSLVIAFSFPRYADETVSFVKAAKKKEASLLAITDHELSPIGFIADYLLKVKTSIPTALKGMPVIFSVLNVIVNGIAVHDFENVQKRIGKYDHISKESGLFPFAKKINVNE